MEKEKPRTKKKIKSFLVSLRTRDLVRGECALYWFAAEQILVNAKHEARLITADELQMYRSWRDRFKNITAYLSQRSAKSKFDV